MSFSAVAALLISIILVSCSPSPQRFSESDWRSYQNRFVLKDGRVIDTGNENVSHSEGQGYGLLLALAANDKTGFARIWDWTHINLQLRDDKLFVWRRRPGYPLSSEDMNNASDGDILIAWALLLAGDRWNVPAYRKNADDILADVKHKLVRRWRSHSILLPGAYGFEKQSGYTVNLSHWVFPALAHFAKYDPSPLWVDLINSGVAILEQARFGRWGLPPDWLELGEELNVATTKRQLFGYNTVRIPLYLIWADRHSKANLSPFRAYWSTYQDFIPAWTNLIDDSIDSYPASDGVLAVANLVFYKSGVPLITSGGRFEDQQDYYSASLILLSRLANYQEL